MQIYIENLTFDAILGILPIEREKRQKIVVNAKIQYDYKSDNFIDYVKIIETIKSTIITEKFELLEDALKFLTKELKKKFSCISQIELKISKPDILQECIVAVKIKKNFKKN